MRVMCIPFLLLLLAQTVPAPGQTPSDSFAKIPIAMQAFVDKGEAAGIVCLVSDADKTLHVSAVGLADIESKSEMKPNSIFRIASMTKPVTSVALMQLVAQGKLRLDDPVSKYIPSFAKLKLKDGSTPRPITIKDVMTHTAGVAGSAGWVENQTLEQFCEGIANEPLAFAPGEKWSYSSGITIGGRLIEIASGEEYSAYLKNHIFTPLEMNDTGFTLNPEQAKRVATTYKNGAKPGALDKVDTPDPAFKRIPSPSGGLYSTAEDMARFYREVLQDFTASKANLLPADAAKTMLTKQSGEVETGFTAGNAWGIGWCLVQKPQGVSAKLSPGSFGHGGAWGTQGWVDPVKNRIVVLMVQRVGLPNSDASEMRRALNELAIP